MEKKPSLFAICAFFACFFCLGESASDGLPKGYWGEQQTAEILDKTLRLRLAPDLSGLEPGEKKAVEKLIEAGHILHQLYELSGHPQALEAHENLVALDKKLGSTQETRNLLDLYRLSRGPIAVTLDNKRLPFLPVDDVVPGKNVYPWGVTKDAVTRFLEENPHRRDAILHVRSVVRAGEAKQIEADLATLEKYPQLDVLHPGLRDYLTGLKSNSEAFYAVPYSVAWPAKTMKVYYLLWEASDAVAPQDMAFARYLRNRARDLISDDYESGDASWITSRFGKLNAQIGSYETYDDELFGVKSFYSMSILLRDEEPTDELSKAIKGIQALEDSLPYDRQKKVREDIPVGVYHVIADFGQARGTNTASILPNESYITRKYGRTILLRYNIMTHPEIFKAGKAVWDAAVTKPYRDHLTMQSNFRRTLWHEVGHYLGPDTDVKGRTLGVALGEYADLLEEMKADLVSLFSAQAFFKQGFYTRQELHAVYAGGVRRTLQMVKPRRSQPYQTMQLMQMNYFLENVIISLDPSQQLRIHYDRYHETVAALLKEVMAIQSSGDREAAERFIERYATWDEARHGVLAEHMRKASQYRFRLVTYEAFGE